MKAIPIIMLSGMGADERVFEEQLKAFPQLIVPRWIEPSKDESLKSYAERFADSLEIDGPCYIGGASFGGLVALEMMQFLDVEGCFLIGSFRSSDELPAQLKLVGKLLNSGKKLPFQVATLLSRFALLSSGDHSESYYTKLLTQLSDSDAHFMSWACRAVADWKSSEPLMEVPIYQIHGAKDIVLPVGCTSPDRVVAGAGHALSVSHPDDVNDFITEVLSSD